MSLAHGVEVDQSLIGREVSADEIPIIDLGPFLSGDCEARKAVARKIGAACREIGFFYIVNHGVGAELQARTVAQAKRFFAQPLEKKLEIDIKRSPCHRGYFALGGEKLDPAKQTEGDMKEGLKIGRHLPAHHPLVARGLPLHGPNQWPEDLPGWRETMEEYWWTLEELGRDLMRAFALSLDLEEYWFHRWLKTPMCTAGPLHYPPFRGRMTEAKISAGAHTDFGCLTILWQDMTGGLQVKNRHGEWLAAPCVEGAYVVNIGDMMARWTNDLYVSTPHRGVVTSGAERLSIPFFFDPDHDTPVACLPTCEGPGNPAKYAPTTGLQHLLDRIDETFEYRHDGDAAS